MSEKKNKNTEKKADGMASAAKNTPMGKKKRLALILGGAIGGAVLCAGVVLTVIFTRPFGYLTSDLSRYVRVDYDAAYTAGVSVRINSVTDTDVEEDILGTLAAYKNKEAEHSGAFVTSQPVSAGDVAYIYYRGYVIGEDGTVSYPAGTCNFGSASPASLEIGSGSFIPGFEIGLVGQMPTPEFQIFRDGTYRDREGSLSDGAAYLSFLRFAPDGTYTSASSMRFDLSDPAATDALWGDGFTERVKGLTVGQKADDFTLPMAGGDAVYSGLTVDYITSGDTLYKTTVTTYFPTDYANSEELAGRTAYFDVYILKTVVYTAPELTEEFIFDTLGYTSSDLSGFDGATVPEKYRASVRARLVREYEEKKNDLVGDAFIEALCAAATVKKLPKTEVDAQYSDYYDALVTAFENYSKQYGGYASVEEFAPAYYGLSEGENYKDYLRAQAEKVVREKLVFYSVMRQKGLVPAEEEITKKTDDLIAQELAYFAVYYGVTESRYPSESEYHAALLSLREEMLDYYGEDYYRQNAYYALVMPKLTAGIGVTLIDREG